MASEYQTVGEQLLSTNVTLENATSDSDILNFLERFNYTEAKIAEGKELHKRASELVVLQDKEFGEQVGATDDKNRVLKDSKKKVSDARSIAKVAFKDDVGALRELKLTERVETKLGEYIKQSGIFYLNILRKEEYLVAMANFGYTKEKIENEASLLTKILDLNQIKESETGDVVRATKKRDEALDELNDWMADFKKVANIALEGQDGLLKKLGIYEKEGGSKDNDQSDNEQLSNNN